MANLDLGEIYRGQVWKSDSAISKGAQRMGLRISTDEQEIRQIADSWNSLCLNPNSDLEHYLLVCRLRKEVLSPWVVSVGDGGECKAIIAGRIEDTVLRPKIGYLRLPGIRVRTLVIIYEGVLGVVGNEEAEAFCNAVLGTFREHQIQVITFNHLSDRHFALWEALRNFKHSVGLLNPDWSPHRALNIQGDPGVLFKKMSRKHRIWIKSRERKLNEVFEGAVVWHWEKEFDDLGKMCDRVEAVARRTYQRGLGAGFVDNEETRQRLSLFGQRGMLRLTFLEGKNRPLSFRLTVIYKGTGYASGTGYLPEVAEFRVGTLTLCNTVEQLAGEGISRLDYGLGDADYKKRFSDTEWREATFHIFAPDWKGKILRSYMAMADTIDRKLRKLATQGGLSERIKKRWRNVLRPSP